MTDWLDFITMKKALITTLLILFCFCLAQEAKGHEEEEEEDLLLKVMKESWGQSLWQESYQQSQEYSDNYNEVSEVYSVDYEDDQDSGEVYSWDNLYLDRYQNIEVIIDPYSDEEF